jgi:hypothetical protein
LNNDSKVGADVDEADRGGSLGMEFLNGSKAVVELEDRKEFRNGSKTASDPGGRRRWMSSNMEFLSGSKDIPHGLRVDIWAAGLPLPGAERGMDGRWKSGGAGMRDMRRTASLSAAWDG